MREVSFNRFGDGPRGRGMSFPPFIPLLLGLLVLFLIVKSGLWLPLLVVGLVIWLFSPMRHHWHGGFRPMNRNWRARHYYDEPTPRKNNDIEYV